MEPGCGKNVSEISLLRSAAAASCESLESGIRALSNAEAALAASVDEVKNSRVWVGGGRYWLADGALIAANGKCLLLRLGWAAMLASSNGLGVGYLGVSKMRCDGSGDGDLGLGD